MKYLMTCFLSAVFCVLVINTILIFTMRHQHSIHHLHILDTGKHNQSNVLNKSEARLAVFGTSALSYTTKPKLILMGASVVREGLRPEDWRQYASNIEIHNVGVGSANFLALQTLWTHLEKSIDKSVAQRSTVVIGVVYSMISNNVDNYINREDGRLNPLYLLGIRWWGTDSIWRFIKLQTYRYFALDEYLKAERQYLLSYFNLIMQRRNAREFIVPIEKPVVIVKKIVPTDHKAIMKRWIDEIMRDTHLRNKHFELLTSLIHRIRQAGFKVMVVSMPLPTWHRDKSPTDAAFCQRLNLLMKDLITKDKNIFYLDVHKEFKDNEFRDSAHLSRAAAKRMSLKLYKELSQQGIIASLEKS